MKVWIILAALVVRANVAEASLPACGIVASEEGSGEAFDLWGIAGSLGKSSGAGMELISANGARGHMRWSQPGEAPLATFRHQSRIFLLTAYNRGYGLYEATTVGGLPVLTLLRHRELVSARDGRQLFSRLIDVVFSEQGGAEKIHLLSEFQLAVISVREFLSESRAAKVFELPVSVLPDQPRPVAIFPEFLGNYSNRMVVYQARLGRSNNWIGKFFWYPQTENLEIVPYNISYDFTHRIRGRESESASGWLVVNQTMQSIVGDSFLFNSGYPYDAFQRGGEILVQIYGRGAQLVRDGLPYCQAFEAEDLSSVAIFFQETLTGRQKILLGVRPDGTLLKVAMYEESGNLLQ